MDLPDLFSIGKIRWTGSAAGGPGARRVHHGPDTARGEGSPERSRLGARVHWSSPVAAGEGEEDEVGP
jgi:hypothetical protein